MCIHWNAEQYRKNASFVPALGASVFDLLKPKPDESILDLGCGDGSLTEKIIARDLIGIDASPSMVKAARARGLNAVLMRGDEITYRNKFDAVFSNAALHWIQDYRAVLQGVARALKPGGRFVGEFGGQGNIATIITAIQKVLSQNPAGDEPNMGEFHNPWFFPSAEQYKGYLEEHGFTVRYIELIPRPTPLKSGGMLEWLKIFATQSISGMPEHRMHEFLEKTEQELRPSLFSDGGWQADYVRLRFYATT